MKQLEIENRSFMIGFMLLVGFGLFIILVGVMTYIQSPGDCSIVDLMADCPSYAYREEAIIWMASGTVSVVAGLFIGFKTKIFKKQV